MYLVSYWWRTIVYSFCWQIGVEFTDDSLLKLVVSKQILWAEVKGRIEADLYKGSFQNFLNLRLKTYHYLSIFHANSPTIS